MSIDIKCPKCGEENFISSKWTKQIDESDEQCRFCGYEATTHDFIDCYENSLEPAGEMWDPWEDIGFNN